MSAPLASARRLVATYEVRAEVSAIEARAHALAVEQSVEMPVSAIADERIRSEIVGQVEGIEPSPGGEGWFSVRISLSPATIGADPGQLLNMLFGNSSLHDDVMLQDVVLPAELAAVFGGPRHGIEGLRDRLQAQGRALACAALKPQGLDAGRLADLAQRFARGGVDVVKDDHGIADQDDAPFAARVPAIAAAVRAVSEAAGRPVAYAPNLSGNLDQLRRQAGLAREVGLATVLVAPMVVGLANFHTLVVENPDLAFIAHPAFGGAVRIAPPLLLGKLFRLFGADAVIFPHSGGRFGFTRQTCLALADAARTPWCGLRPSLPVAAGGMSRDRVPELLSTYGADIMLLIGGALLAAGPALVEETAAFVAMTRG